MTVIRPNSIAGINSITVQSGQALNVHDASGNLIRSLTNESGISTFSGINVGTALTIQDNGNIAVTGIVTAASYIGDGSGLTGVASTDNISTGTTANMFGGLRVGTAATIFANGNVTAGIVTATTLDVSGNQTVSGTVQVAGNSNFGAAAASPSPSALTVKIATNKHIGFNPSQSEVGNVPALVAFQDNGSLASIGFRGSDVRFAAGSAERFRITDNTELGIAGANYGTAGQVLTSGGSGSAVSWATAAGGIQDFDRWHLTADTSGNTNPIENNWSRWTSYGGTGTVTFSAPSSGLWTFPSTGFWHIDWYGMFTVDNKAERGCNLYIYVTTNDSSYVFVTASETSAHDSSAVTKTWSRCTYVFDVTSTSTHKVKFACGYNQSNNTLLGHGSYLYSNVCFTKLRDT